MKTALLSALMFGAQLTRAEDDLEPRRKYAKCWFSPSYGITMDDPEISGVLLMAERRGAD